MKNIKLTWWKLVATWVLFLALHYSYETFPNILFKVIGEEGEPTLFHMKMLFFAYLFTTLFEYFLQRKKISSTQTFLTSRMLIAVPLDISTSGNTPLLLRSIGVDAASVSHRFSPVRASTR